MKGKKISQLKEMNFRMECSAILQAVVKKMQTKSPLKYSMVQNLTCLDPKQMVENPTSCKDKFKKILKLLLDASQLSGGLVKGNCVLIWSNIS